MEIVSVADLKIGMFVAEPDCPWTELPFALQGFVISKPEQISVFQRQCRFVNVDRSRSRDEQYRQPKQAIDRRLLSQPFAQTTAAEPAGRHRASPGPAVEDDPLRYKRRRFLEFLHRQDGSEYARELAQELACIEPRFDDFQTLLQASFRSIAAEQQIDLAGLTEGIRDMSGSLKRNPDALMWLLQLKRVDRYSFDHAMDVAVHLLLLGNHIGWRGKKLIELGTAGLLQDIGKTQLPPDLLTKVGPLSDEEQGLIRSHVASSLEILYASTHLPNDVLLIISRHHERWDGSGYPRRLKLDQLGLAAEMAGLVDSFCAMLKNKPYRDALGHQGALEEIYRQRNKQFNPVLMEQFVQCVGLYPVGTLVELSRGEVGVVIQQNRAQRSRPRILLLLDRDKAPVPGYKLIDLRDASHGDLQVVKALPHDACGLSADDYYLR